jgi:Uma2 family endonuclease
MPATQRRRWTAREVRDLITANPLVTPRYELVDGELLVTPSPSALHQVAVRELLIALAAYLETTRVGEVLLSPFDVEPEPEFLAQPDLFVIPPHEARRLRSEMPARELLLVVEVLSPSSGRHDRVRKRPFYQRNVPEYWIVDLDAHLVERWRSADVRPEVVSDLLTWQPPGAAEGFSLPLSRFFARVFGESAGS